MGDNYLATVIAAVVPGGVSILGGRGSFAAAFVGAFFITLLSSLLSLMQVADAVRRIVSGGIIFARLPVRHRRKLSP